MSEPILKLDNVEIEYQVENSENVTAVSNCSFSIDKGEYFGLVGESGCGKSTVVKSIVGGLDSNGRIKSGEILFNGKPIHTYSELEYRRDLRWKEIAVIPQASMNSLDPITKLSEQAIEIAQTHTNWSENKILKKLSDLFERVGLSESRINDYPHQFSGGMEQRASIAFALLLEPSLIIADEPTTALDVIKQDEIFAYFDKLKEDDFTLLLITHDMSVVLENCDSMAVLHSGQTAESGDVNQLHQNPSHPYTSLLQKAFPDLRHPNQELEQIKGIPPELTGEIDYCTFADRCPWAAEECKKGAPPLELVGDSDSHYTSCIRHDEIESFETTDSN